MRLEKSVIINRPAEVVFAFVTNPEKVPLWMPIQQLRQVSPGPVGVGSVFAQSADFMGQRFDGTIQITAFDPPRTFAFKVLQGPFPLTNYMSFTALDSTRTSMTLIGEAEPGKVLKIAGPLLVPLARKQLENQIFTLKRLVEAER